MDFSLKDFIRPLFYSIKDTFDYKGKKRLRNNIDLYNRYLNKRGFLFCTGESIRHIDIELLTNEYTFGINLFFLHEKFQKINLKYYVCLDNKLFDGMPQWPANLLGRLGSSPMRKMYKELNNRVHSKTELILNSECYNHSNNLFQNNKLFFAKVNKALNLNNKSPYKSHLDFTKKRIPGGGSVYFAILIMIYMGFKKIYLCGAGYTYSPEYVYHFYDNIIAPKNLGKKNAIHSIKKEIEKRRKNGATIEYYGLLENYNAYRGICISHKNNNNPAHLGYHKKLKEYAESQGVEIINVIPERFESPVYKSINFNEIQVL